MKRYAGMYLMFLAVVHTIIGVVIFAEPLADVIDAGFVDGMQREDDRAAAIWFLYFGFFMGVLGYLAHWTYGQMGTLPRGLGWGVLLMAGVGAILVPSSGFWLLLPLGWIAFERGPVPQRAGAS